MTKSKFNYDRMVAMIVGSFEMPKKKKPKESLLCHHGVTMTTADLLIPPDNQN